MDEFDEERKLVLHEIGSNLDALSVEELDARIGLLEGEIERLRQNIANKSDSLDAAESAFKS